MDRISENVLNASGQTSFDDDPNQAIREFMEWLDTAKPKELKNVGDKIDRSKELADPEKYFRLFDKYIPRYANGGKGKNIALIDISSMGVERRIIELNLDATYWLFDGKLDYDCLKTLCPNVDIRLCRIEIATEDLYNILEDNNMKFDLVIGNPPYDRSLHLKILKKIMDQINEDGEVVWLAPIRWLQDPLAKYKKNSAYHKYENCISKYIKDLKVIPKLTAQEYFTDTVMGADLGVYICNKKGGWDYNSLINKMLLKIFNKLPSLVKFEENKKDGYRVRFPVICNNGGSGNNRKVTMATFGKMLWFIDGLKDDKPWYEWYMKNQYSKNIDVIPYSVKFNSAIEAENFCKSFDTTFVKVYTHMMKSDVNVTPEIVLYVGDAVNPRTGLKGYLSDWTDKDFYKYFNITDNEKKIIEETMAKYK